MSPGLKSRLKYNTAKSLGGPGRIVKSSARARLKGLLLTDLIKNSTDMSKNNRMGLNRPKLKARSMASLVRLGLVLARH